MAEKLITRLAPSPTGLLHMGNAWAFILTWLAARSAGGKVWLRMDDIDPERSRSEYARAIIRDLQWLGLDWDNPSSEGIIWQSSREKEYKAALDKLSAKTYPCFCTRKELRSIASAPHIGDEGVFYPGTCAQLGREEREKLARTRGPGAIRLDCAGEEMEFKDIVQGEKRYGHRDFGGDFPLRRSDGVWSYQLVSAVDDGLSGVNLVCRGRDLLPSTPRQIIIMERLGMKLPAWAHLPLLLDENGERLAKRHKSLSLAVLRENGIRAEHLCGYLLKLAGLNPAGRIGLPGEFIGDFGWELLPKNDILIAQAPWSRS